MKRGASLFLLLSAAAFAQESGALLPAGGKVEIGSLDMEELLDQPVEAASLKLETARTAPAPVYVITGAEIRQHGYRTLPEVLRSVPGLSTYSDSIYPSLSVRGLGLLGDYDTRVLFLVDGHPLNDSVMLMQGFERDLPVNLYAIERVEVIKGPYGGIYGPNAFFGVVNIVTRTLPETGAEMQLSGDVAGQKVSGGEFALTASKHDGPVEVLLNLGVFQSAGEDYHSKDFGLSADRPVPADLTAHDVDGLQAGNLYGRVRWKELTFGVGFFTRNKQLPTAPYSSLIGDPRNVYVNANAYSWVRWSRPVSDSLRLSLSGSFDWANMKDELSYEDGLFRDLGVDRYGTLGAQLEFTAIPHARLMISTELQVHDILLHSGYATTADGTVPEVHGTQLQYLRSNSSALFEYAFSERLRTQLGVTLLVHQLFGTQASPKLAVVYEPTDTDTVKLHYSQGVRPPIMAEAFFEDGVDFLANPKLRSERALSLEADWEHRFGSTFSLAGSAFHSRYDDVIQFLTVPNPSLEGEPDPMNPADYRQQATNVELIHVDGVELSAIATYPFLHARGGLSLQASRYAQQQNQEQPNFAPAVLNIAADTAELLGLWTLSVDAAAVAKRNTDWENLLPGQRSTVDPYLLLNAVLSVKLPGHTETSVQLGAYNLLNSAILHPVPGDFAPLSTVRESGRSVRLTLRTSF